MEIVKKIKENKKFTVKEKQDILNKYVGMSKDNNSYFTPVVVCNWIKELLNISNGKVADLSAGIGNMVIPFVTEYGKLVDNIEFDLYEYDENNSLAGSKAWEDYSQLNFYGEFDSLNGDIPDNHYDFIIGNPPFSGSIPYFCEWNNTKGKAKNNNICDAFVDLSIRKCKDKGYIALVLPMGHLFKGNATEKLRNWMKETVSIKGVFPLDSETFKDSGVLGTVVGTVLVIMQKGTPQKEIFIGDLSDKDETEKEMKSIAEQFQIFLSSNYDIGYRSDFQNGLHGILNKREDY